MERGGDNRGESAGGSYSSVSIDPTQIQCIKLYGISEGEEECADCV
jgi:hypothetical protein